jgi:SWI/SNF-related matrix-associated actin-dependent regulator of chromatin subfamily A3
MGRRFRHTITGARSETAEGALGGILADDMGLGKTLTMLAAIATSLPRAEQFVESSMTAIGDDTGHSAPIRLKSTLVVVPSECKSISLRLFAPLESRY